MKWTRKELIARAIWETLQYPLFYASPRILWAWRRWILRIFGARIERNVRIHPTCRIAVPWNLNIGENACLGDGVIAYSLGVITVGRDATISQYAHLCAGSHDHRKVDMPLQKLPIVIGAGAWICADAFIGPGVIVGDGAVVGARAVVVRDVPCEAIVAGNPARVVGERKMQSSIHPMKAERE